MNGNRGFSLLVLVSCGALAGCRLERAPAGSPFAAVDAGRADDAADDAVASSGRGADGSGDVAGSAGSARVNGGTQPGAGGLGGDTAPGPAGASGMAVSTAGAAGSGSAAGEDGAAVDPGEVDAAVGADSCTPKVAECNPVTNEGCPPTMQCAVDFTAPTLAGYCIFSTPSPMLENSCFNSGVTESCPPSSTCFEFQCRTLCLCDADCEEGCCVDPVGSLGFKVCGDC